ncbi:MAG: DEAD/DEAH box helicase family protein [Candidatus Moranbacteria bacterium]|nr:DEAD/DEAH box helicase family protein [Candidatus Moranbacteria bacterium]
MKFKFLPKLEYQLDAIAAIVDIFESGKNAVRDTENFALHSGGSSIVKNELDIDQQRILSNVHAIQKQNKLVLAETSGGGMGVEMTGVGMTGVGADSVLKYGSDFSVEMETGTGKTYVYLRTILELNKRYGLRKFIILVPSVAIREGVLKTIEQTKEHFRDLYGNGFGYFAYDSGKLSRVREFVQSIDTQIMIMTIQSFNSGDRVMRQTPDRFHGERPIDLVAQTRPVVIMDEPQNMESELSRSAIEELRPLCKLRYSATHKNVHNLMYRLTPVDAYRQGLVKKIEVYGVKDNDPNVRVFSVKKIEIKAGQSPKAKVFLEIVNANGDFLLQEMLVRAGDSLERKTKNGKYTDLLVSEIDARKNIVALSNGEEFGIDEEVSGNKEAIFRTQIHETIKAHFEKQGELGDMVKVLSLFFIDKVDNYIRSDSLIRRIFEEEFEKLRGHHECFKDANVAELHKGYFASKKEKGNIVFQDTRGDSKIDKEAYDLIMKDKERLLSFAEPTCFIFSHSALKEGWDNPNIFQICTLVQTRDESTKRQKIGRGLRLPVDINGDRVYDVKTNILTVIANESYEEFVSNLQREYTEAGYRDLPDTGNARAKVRVKFRKHLASDNEDFQRLWEKIRRKTKFNIAIHTEHLITKCVEEIDALDVQNLVVRVEKVMVDFGKDGKIKTIYQGEAVGAKLKSEVRIGNIINRIALETGITRKTVFTIVSHVSNLELLFENGEEYVRSVIIKIKNVMNDMLINEGLQYIPLDDVWEVELFEDFESYKTRALKSEKAAFEYVVFDSEGEKEFAQNLELSPRVTLFTKLPAKFVVDTPLGTYNPDWAIVMKDNEGKERLYLVRETKFIEDIANLRPSERQKILCGEKHFQSIGVDFKVLQERGLRDLV